MTIGKHYLGKIIANFIALTLCLNLAFAAENNGIKPAISTPKLNNFIPAPPVVEATSYIMIDIDSGKVLAAKDPNLQVPPASLTKMMTAYVLFSALKNGQVSLNDKVKVSKKAWKTGGSRMFIRAGKNVSVDDLIQGIIVASGNDASVAIAEYIAGSEDAFVSLMNQQAKLLGMNNTHFTDATGLPSPDQYSTAADFAKLSQALQINFPEYLHYFKQKWFTYAGIKQPNRNRLLWRDSDITGLKTGHTEKAGYCLAASADKNGMRITSVLMGAPSDSARSDDSQRLLTYGYRFFETHKLYPANSEISAPRIYGGEEKNTSLGLNYPLYVTVPRDQRDNLKAQIELNAPIKAPIQQGQVLGKLIVKLNDQTVAEAPLVALTANPEGGVWRRMSDSVSLKMSGWFGDDESAAG